jgi:hypothetical protein
MKHHWLLCKSLVTMGSHSLALKNMVALERQWFSWKVKGSDGKSMVAMKSQW